MYGLKKLLEIKAERDRKRAEREEKKKEKKKAKEEEKKRKKKEKKKEKSLARKKILKSKQNKRAYAKIREKRLQEHKEKGDTYGYHMIVLVKNRKKVKRLGLSWWRLNAIEKYDKIVEKNVNEVKFPVLWREQNEASQKKSTRVKPVKYEVLLVSKTADTETEGASKFRNKEGKFIDNIIVDNQDYVILAKHDWNIEETFNVYGYHPEKDRKTFSWIMENLIMNDLSELNVKRIFVFNNKLFIQYDDKDFDFIICKTSDEAKRLYNAIEKEVNGNKYIAFTGELSSGLTTWILNAMVEKTGWSRAACDRIHTL